MREQRGVREMCPCERGIPSSVGDAPLRTQARVGYFYLGCLRRILPTAFGQFIGLEALLLVLGCV